MYRFLIVLLALYQTVVGSRRIYDKEARLRRLSDAEFDLHLQRGMSVLAAEEAVNARVEEAFASVMHNKQKEAPEAAGPDSADEEEAFWKSESEELRIATAQTEKEFEQEQATQMLHGIKPDIQGQICMELDIDLSSVLMVPGLNLNLGLMGGVSYDMADGCWRTTFEAFLGFDWGFKVMGYGFGLGASVTGTLELAEVPVAQVARELKAANKSLDSQRLAVAPEGADPKRCYTKSPWTLIQTYIEGEYGKFFRETIESSENTSSLNESAEYQEALEFLRLRYGHLMNLREDWELVDMHKRFAAPSKRSYQAVMEDLGVSIADSGSPMEFEKPKHAIKSSRLAAPAGAMLHAMRLFVARLPAYADQIMDRLVDNDRWLRGTDSYTSFTSKWISSSSRLKHSTGRYWARWPSFCALQKLAGEARERTGDPNEMLEKEVCPWLLPPESEQMKCVDGTFCDVQTDQTCCDKHGGNHQCPSTHPIMCANRDCGNDYCCSADCSDYGVRSCPVVEESVLRCCCDTSTYPSICKYVPGSECPLSDFGRGNVSTVFAGDNRNLECLIGLTSAPHELNLSDVEGSLERWDAEHRKPLAGVTKDECGADQRVMNFAKVTRSSAFAHTVAFWKELAMSASNLLVRVVGDVKALYSTYLADDPNWDGSCQALPATFFVGEPSQELLRKYPWASSSTRPDGRTAFFKNEQNSNGLPHIRALVGVPQFLVRDNRSRTSESEGFDLEELIKSVNDSVIYPHLWCVLATYAPTTSDSGEQSEQPPKEQTIDEPSEQPSEQQERDVVHDHILGKLRNTQSQLEISLRQTCEIVSEEERDLSSDDTLVWDATTGEITVKATTDSPVGILRDQATFEDVVNESRASLGTDELKALGYKVVSKQTELRQDCERVALPVGFVRIFPHFTRLILEYVDRMEAILLSINSCIDQVDTRFKRERIDACATEAGRLEHVAGRAEDAVRLVRIFLLQLGAEDPRTSIEDFKTDRHAGIPLSTRELEVIERSKTLFAPAANLMAMEFMEAFGMGITEETMAKKANGNFNDILTKPGNGVYGTPDKYQLEGRFWHNFKELRQKIYLISMEDPIIRLESESQTMHRVPLVITTAWVFTAQLSPNGFCTPNTGLLMVQHVRTKSRQTWSNHVSKETCWVGRMRPGDFFIQISRCKGTNGGQLGDNTTYLDWRVRFQDVLVKGGLFESGTIGNLLRHHGLSDSGLTSLMTIGGLLGGGLSSRMVKKWSSYVLKSKFMQLMLMLAATSTPLAGVMAGAAVGSAIGLTGSGFRNICTAFLDNLADHGIIDAPDKPPTRFFSASSYLVVWGTVVHREKEKMTCSNCPAEISDEVRQTATYQRRFSMHVENWNRMQLAFPIPGAVSLKLYGQANFNWDITPLIERVYNRRLYLKNQGRVQKCVSCLQQRLAFCDWRIAIRAKNWNSTRDGCLPDTDDSRESCEMDIGARDAVGKPLLAIYYNISDGLASCYNIDFKRANREFRLNEFNRRFFRRH